MTNSVDLIRNKDDLRRFIDADLFVRDIKKLPVLYQFRRPILHYTILLRRCEYYQNSTQTVFSKPIFRFLGWRRKMLGAKLGFSISTNVFGPGLYIVHWGSVVVSSKARIGSNARVHSGINISGEPIIGSNVYLGPGSIVVGDIKIGDGVKIGANTVVTKDVPAGATILGNPGRIIK